MNQPEEKLWTRHFIVICLVNLLSFIAFHMLIASFPFFVKSLGGDDALAGVVTGIFSVATLLTRPLVGWTLDNISRRLLLMIGLAAMCLLAVGYSIFMLLPLIVILRFTHGVAWAFVNTSNNTNACDHVPPGRFGEGMGFFGVTTSMSMALAPALGLALKDNLGFAALFRSSAIIAFGALALAQLVDYKPLPATERIPLSHSLKFLLEKSALPAAATLFFFIIPYGAINTFIALYAWESGIGSGGLYFAVIAISCAVMRFTGGRIADRYGERPVVYFSSATMALSMLLLALIKSPIAFLCSALIFGLGFGMMPPAMQTFAMRTAAPEHRGAAASTYLCSLDLGIGAGGIISGFLVKYLGHNSMFAYMMLPACASFLVYLLWAGKSPSAFKSPS